MAVRSVDNFEAAFLSHEAFLAKVNILLSIGLSRFVFLKYRTEYLRHEYQGFANMS